jgi:hypothetical protein
MRAPSAAYYYYITGIQARMLMLATGRDIQMLTFGLIALVMSIATIDRRRIKIIK